MCGSEILGLFIAGDCSGVDTLSYTEWSSCRTAKGGGCLVIRCEVSSYYDSLQMVEESKRVPEVVKFVILHVVSIIQCNDRLMH